MAIIAWPLSLLQTYQQEITLSITCLFLSICFYYYCCFFCCSHPGSIVPVNWPVLGMLPVVVTQFNHLHDYATDALRVVGLTYMFKGPWFLGMNCLVTCDPANVQHVFTANFPNYPKGDDFVEICDVLGGALFSSDGDAWRVQRKMAHAFIGDRAFRSSTFMATRNKVEHGLLPLLDRLAATGQTVDLENVFSRVTFDITSVMIFGSDPASLSLNFPAIPFADAIDDFWEAVLLRHSVPKSWWKLLRWLNLGSEKKMARAKEVIDLFIAQQIKQEREERKNGLLTYYMDQSFEDVKEIFDSESKFLRDTVLFLMIAGRDAFAIGLSWLFWLLSKNPDVEAKILEELRAHVKRKKTMIKVEGPIVFDVGDVETMVYLHGAICETLRFFPPVPIEHKSSLNADVLPSGHTVDPGTKILFMVYTMGRMEEIWGKDCMEFKPERWISERGKIKHVPAYKFMSFNSGQRSCLGKEIGLTQLKIVTAGVLANFEVEVVRGHKVEPKLSGMLRMKKGMRACMRKRLLF